MQFPIVECDAPVSYRLNGHVAKISQITLSDLIIHFIQLVAECIKLCRSVTLLVQEESCEIIYYFSEIRFHPVACGGCDILLQDKETRTPAA